MSMRVLRPSVALPVFILLVIIYFLSFTGSDVSKFGTPRRPFARPAPAQQNLHQNQDQNQDQQQQQQGKFDWSRRQEQHPVRSKVGLPRGRPVKMPRIQLLPRGARHQISAERQADMRAHREAVKVSLRRAWQGYRDRAWMADELRPISGTAVTHFGGWASTMVDSLDTLWIMGMREEFEEAVAAVERIDFSATVEEEINTFETNIRYLGGLIAAYDLTDNQYPSLLTKAVEVGDLLYAAFDTPNRMPITRWHWKKTVAGEPQEADSLVLLAEIGSFSLEFTRLSQLTGDPKFYDAAHRVLSELEKHQSYTKLPGMWPMVINAREIDFSGENVFSVGAMADSTYEYLPKLYVQLGGLSQAPRKMYEKAIEVVKQYNIFRPMVKGNMDIRIASNVRVEESNEVSREPQAQHLACYVGGMMAVASRIFKREEDLSIARRLVDGCIWSYEVMPSRIMAETFFVIPCLNETDCKWDEKLWRNEIIARHQADVNEENFDERVKQLRLPPGITDLSDRRYVLRPEAIESIFILYRITGDERLRDVAWNMFRSIEKHTRTAYGSAALNDVSTKPPEKGDSMESFWTAETLKYFYLIFSEMDLISLDEYVFNTEAHPFRRPV